MPTKPASMTPGEDWGNLWVTPAKSYDQADTYLDVAQASAINPTLQFQQAPAP